MITLQIVLKPYCDSIASILGSSDCQALSWVLYLIFCSFHNKLVDSILQMRTLRPRPATVPRVTQLICVQASFPTAVFRLQVLVCPACLHANCKQLPS